jgi:hypothetical protein
MKATISIFLALLFLFSIRVNGTTYYVSKSNSNAINLSSAGSISQPWKELRYALSQNILPGDIIKVASVNEGDGGAYFPDCLSPNNRYESFTIPAGVTIQGGYNINFTERNISLYETVLSGEIGTEDISDNSYHVVKLQNNSSISETTIDGFTITGGNANDGQSGIDSRGSGILANDINTTVLNCELSNNYQGVPIYMAKSGKIIQCQILNNYSSAAHIQGSVLQNCIVSNNDRYSGSTIILNDYNGTPSVMINCLVTNNNTDCRIGSINADNSKIINSTIANNNMANYEPYVGYEIHLNNSDIFNSIVWGNTTGSNYSYQIANVMLVSSPSEIRNCAVQDEAQLIYNPYGNIASYDLVDLHKDNNGNLLGYYYPRFINPTSFTGCAVDQSQLDELNNANWTISKYSNCIDVGYNNIINTYSILTDIIGNPRITYGTVDIGAYEVFNGRLYVKEVACGDESGRDWNNAMDNIQDALNNDLGITDVWVAQGTYKPDRDKNGDFNPIDERTKCFTIPYNRYLYGGFEGIEDELSERIIENNPWEFKFETKLTGEIQENDNNDDNTYTVVFFNSSNEISQSNINGFSVEEGNANYSISDGHYEKQSGGGIFSDLGGIVENCIIKANYSLNEGGGIYLSNSGLISKCLLIYNVAQLGGGAYLMQSSIQESTITSNDGILTYYDNSNNTGAFYGAWCGNGGGIYLSDGIVSECFINNNYAFSGGGIYVKYSQDGLGSEIYNCVINNNYAHNTEHLFWNTEIIGALGAGVFCNSTYSLWINNRISITNNTICNNLSVSNPNNQTFTADGGGVYVFRHNTTQNNQVELTNNIIWGNEADALKNQIGYLNTDENPLIDANSIEGGFTLSSNTNTIDLDVGNEDPNGPNFTDPTTSAGNNPTPGTSVDQADWSLTGLSVCLDNSNTEHPPKDIIGTVRTSGQPADRGAYELAGSKAASINTNQDCEITNSVWGNNSILYINAQDNSTIYVYSLNGQLLIKKRIDKGMNLIETNLSGLYLVRVLNIGSSISNKVLL